MVEQCGTWTLVREIGRGAAGAVYLAQGANGATAAVKVCLREELGQERYERELRGAKLYRQIPASEGLVRMLELGELEQGFYMVMELADDEFDPQPSATPDYRPKTLSRVIASESALPLERALQVGLTLAKGLVTLQQHHLLHRDVKPGNVIYVQGRPVLSDPGLLVNETEAASLVGTPGYVPPENFVGAGGDVYSLGLTLKAASFGRPVEELDHGPTLEADTNNPLFTAWWRILNKATHPDIAHRYHSAKALLKDLQMLRLRMALMTKQFGLPRLAWIGIIALLTLVSICIAKARASINYSQGRWQSQDEYIASEAEEARKAAKAALEEVKRNMQEVNAEVEKAKREAKEQGK